MTLTLPGAIAFRGCCLASMLALAASAGWSADQPAQNSDANPETATVTGTVSALAPQKHQFTLREDGGNESADYRPYFRNGYPAAMIERVSKLHVGDHLQVTYTEREGRRVIEFTAVPLAPAK